MAYRGQLHASEVEAWSAAWRPPQPEWWASEGRLWQKFQTTHRRASAIPPKFLLTAAHSRSFFSAKPTFLLSSIHQNPDIPLKHHPSEPHQIKQSLSKIAVNERAVHNSTEIMAQTAHPFTVACWWQRAEQFSHAVLHRCLLYPHKWFLQAKRYESMILLMYTLNLLFLRLQKYEI